MIPRFCKNTPAQLVAYGGSLYSWSPTTSLSNANIPNPVANPLGNATYQVKVTDGNGCTKITAINVNIKPVPTITQSKDSLICSKSSVKIFAGRGISYSCTPKSSLDNPASSSPVASPAVTTIYHVQITDAQSCVYPDS